MTSAILVTGDGVNPLWYATRAGGTVALILLTMSVVLGIAVAGAPAQPRDRSRRTRFEVGLLHRNLALLTVAFVLAHVITAIVDPFVRLGWAVAIVPFVGEYRPLWLGLGTVALDLMAAVLITSAMRFRLGRRRWKAVHGLAYGAWLTAIVHALGTGSDTRTTAQLWLYAACLATTCAAVCWRLWRAGSGRCGRHLVAGRASHTGRQWPPSRGAQS